MVRNYRDSPRLTVSEKVGQILFKRIFRLFKVPQNDVVT